MKKNLIILFILVTSVFMTSATNINLSSGDKINNSHWQQTSSITSKINLSSNNLNISGKLISNSKICSGDSCLGICEDGKTWDFSSNSCINIVNELYVWGPGSIYYGAVECKDGKIVNIDETVYSYHAGGQAYVTKTGESSWNNVLTSYYTTPETCSELTSESSEHYCGRQSYGPQWVRDYCSRYGY